VTDDSTALFLGRGCSHHIVRNIELLMNSNDDFMNMKTVNVGYGPNPISRGYGTLWPLGKVLFVPDALHNSTSCRQLTKHCFSINFLDDTATIADCKMGKNIITASTYRSHFNRLTIERDICSTLGSNTLFSQELPSRLQPALCHMTRVLSNIANTTRILHEPHTNVQRTNYQVLQKGNNHEEVANRQRIP